MRSSHQTTKGPEAVTHSPHHNSCQTWRAPQDPTQALCLPLHSPAPPPGGRRTAQSPGTQTVEPTHVPILATHLLPVCLALSSHLQIGGHSNISEARKPREHGVVYGVGLAQALDTVLLLLWLLPTCQELPVEALPLFTSPTSLQCLRCKDFSKYDNPRKWNRPMLLTSKLILTYFNF